MKPRSLLEVIWIVALMIYVVAGAAITPFHGDESTQIYMSRDYAYQFMQRDLSLIRYNQPPISAQEQELRLLNGTVNKYLIGLAWHIGGFTLADINEQWDWGASWEYNTTNNHAPSAALLHVARMSSALLLALGVPVMFALGWLTGGNIAAFAASLLYALHPALLINGRRAMMEGSLIFFSLLTVLAGAWWIKRSGWVALLALGLAAGLTVASKHTGVFTVIAVFGALGAIVLFPRFWGQGGVIPPEAKAIRLSEKPLSPLKGLTNENNVSAPLVGFISPVRRMSGKRFEPLALLGVLLAGIVALITFYALNLAWWGDPITRAGEILALRQDLLEGQTNAFGGYANAVDAAAGFWRQTFITPQQYYEFADWAGYLAEPIRVYEASIWRGVHVGALILVSLVVIGISTLMRKTEHPLRLLIGGWALVMVLSVLLLTPLEWQRYYLPVYPPILLMAGVGISALAGLIRRMAASNKLKDKR